MNILVRPARHADLDDLCTLLAQLFQLERDFKPDRERQLRGLMAVLERDDAVILVASLHASRGPATDEPLLGMVSVQSVLSTAEGGVVGLVEDMVVRDAHRNQGVGARLLQEAEVWARGRGLSRLQLLTDDGNRGALRFYERQGWQSTRLVARRRMLG